MKKISIQFFIFLISVFSFTFNVNAQNMITININSISQDQYIKGEVSNLDNPQDYRVLIYVYTDKWYIHPFAKGGEGRSWASIDENGKWSISTQKREFNAEKVAALVVKKGDAENAPNVSHDIASITHYAIVIYTKH
jgi:hypothetical protein